MVVQDKLTAHTCTLRKYICLHNSFCVHTHIQLIFMKFVRSCSQLGIRSIQCSRRRRPKHPSSDRPRFSWTSWRLASEHPPLSDHFFPFLSQLFVTGRQMKRCTATTSDFRGETEDFALRKSGPYPRAQ